MTDRVRLREMTEADWPAVAAIWAEGIATGNATFETEPPSWAAFDATRRQEGRFVAEHDGAVVGWTALSPVSSRPCYAGVAENSVYVAASARGEGVGTALMEALTDGGRARPGSGRSRRACSRRTPPASRCTSGPGSGSSAGGSGSPSSAASGATRSSSSSVCPT